MTATSKSAQPVRQIIYVDGQDDIASLIGAVEAASKKQVVLVLPKRPEVLSSIVNMKLLRVSASQFEKAVTLVTADRAVTAIAAKVRLPVAKSLKSKSAIPELPSPPATRAEATDGSILQAAPVDNHNSSPKTKKQPVIKVPNFSRFVIRLMLGVIGLIVLVVVWYLAFVVAPRAEIQITTDFELLEDISLNLTLSAQAVRLDADNLIVPFRLETKEEILTQTITATGQKDVSVRAAGIVEIRNCSNDAVSIPAGTTLLSTDGFAYSTNEAIGLEDGDFDSNGNCESDDKTTKAVRITAAEAGQAYNAAEAVVFSLPASFAGSNIGVTTVQAPAGGLEETVAFITQVDLDEALSQLALQRVDESVKLELRQQLRRADMIALDDTFSAKSAEPATEAVVDQEAEEAEISQLISYQLIGVAEKDLRQLLEPEILKRANGLNLVEILLPEANYTLQSIDEATYSLQVIVDARVGFSLGQQAILDKVRGRPADEVAEELRQLDGVVSVTVSVSPPWTNNIPDKPDRIKIDLIHED